MSHFSILFSVVMLCWYTCLLYILTISAILDYQFVLFGSLQAIFTDILGMKRAAAIVPKLLNFEPKQHRMDIAQ